MLKQSLAPALGGKKCGIYYSYKFQVAPCLWTVCKHVFRCVDSIFSMRILLMLTWSVLRSYVAELKPPCQRAHQCLLMTLQHPLQTVVNYDSGSVCWHMMSMFLGTVGVLVFAIYSAMCDVMFRMSATRKRMEQTKGFWAPISLQGETQRC